jgi:hypothetical protein
MVFHGRLRQSCESAASLPTRNSSFCGAQENPSKIAVVAPTLAGADEVIG